MRGLGFLEVVDSLAEIDPSHSALTAGYIVVRTCEITFRENVIDQRAMAYAEMFVGLVREIHVRDHLTAIVEALWRCERDAEGWRDYAAGRLMVYARELQETGQYAPAADTFGVIASAILMDLDLRMQAMLRRGVNLRRIARWDDAAMTYNQLKQVAWSARSPLMELEANLHMADLFIERGNTPAAIPLLAEVIDDAIRQDATHVLATALLGRGTIAGKAHDPAAAIDYSYRALTYLSDLKRRERAMINLAYAFREIARPDTATMIARRLRKSTDAEHRYLGSLVLCHLAIDAEAWPAFCHLGEELRCTSAGPVCEAELHEAYARAYATRGEVAWAREEIAIMAQIAERNRLWELTFRAEDASKDIAQGRIPTIYGFRPVLEIPDSAQEIISAAENAVLSLCAVG